MLPSLALLVIGFALLAGGCFLLCRHKPVIAIILAVVGIVLIFYSLSIVPVT